VDLGRQGANLSGAEEFTVCSEVKIEGTKGQQDIVHLGNYEVLLSWNGDREELIGYFHNETGPQRVAVDGSEYVGEWHRVCSRYGGSELSLWIDGERAGAVEANGSVRLNSGEETIASNGGKTRFLDGEINGVQVYNQIVNNENSLKSK